MKGKNLIIAMFAFVALVVSGAFFALGDTIKNIRYAKATTIEAFTTELEGGVIFSAEKVYFDTSKSGTEGDGDAVEYNGYNFKSIETNKGTKYFADFALRGENYDGDISHKSIVRDGDFVMVDDKAEYSASIVGAGGNVNVKQGLMITLGGYYYDSADDDYKLNGEETGAGIDYVSAQAFLNGKSISIPASRDYQSGTKQDFTWFIVPSVETEGHYEISISYMINGVSLRYDFDFYLLLQSSYEDEKVVNNETYATKPQIVNAENSGSENYKFHYGVSNDSASYNTNYPTLTFDYARYDLNYTYTNGDVVTEIDFDYDEANQVITMSKKLYNDVEVRKYQVDSNVDGNTIVTLMFSDTGKYDFHFDYIYKYQGEKIIIPQEQIPFEDKTLNIYGYQLKYSKAGFSSADMVNLEIYQNGTMFIFVNGFIDAGNEKTGDSLGINYTLDQSDVYKKTGIIKQSTRANINNFEAIELSDIVYQKTDRGLWLTLNDLYLLKGEGDNLESYYYYNATNKISDISEDKRTALSKVSTFTAPGYYLLKVRYQVDDGTSDIYTQYFAFQITSATPILELYKTTAENYSNVITNGAEKNNQEFYAHEYTNQNVYAYWNPTEIFESTVVGKLYYSSGKYLSESDLKVVADGGNNSAVTKQDYTKNTIIKNSGSYLLVLEVERSATKTYTYFTIDKDKIEGLEVYEVATGSVDNNAMYIIKQDNELKYVKLTNKSVIDTAFTLDWANKSSGAKITATYKFTPFIKSAVVDDNNTITVVTGSKTYKYILNSYTIGQTSKDISIQKPTQLSMALNVDNVLMDQGIYEFNLIDQAGNMLTYIMIIDNTSGVINATYGDDKNEYINGQMVADYVELEWGTHKAIDLGNVSEYLDVNETKENIIYNLLNGKNISNYYNESDNNLTALTNMFKQREKYGKDLFVVENKYTEIKLRPFNEQKDVYYIVTASGAKQIKHPNGAITTGWDATANNLFENVTNMGIKINIDENELRRYTFEVAGENQVTSSIPTGFMVYITPDKAQGEVYSSSQEGANFDTMVLAHGEQTDYYANGQVKIDNYANGQASNDGVFAFEWLIPGDEDNFKVTEVRYDYYQLMDQTSLNNIDWSKYTATQGKTKQQVYRETNPYYPYKYISTNYILKMEDDIETISLYEKANRAIKDDKGQTISSKDINRSDAINLAYETYYDVNGNLITKKVTQTGLYIITRKIAINSNDGAEVQTAEMSYVFFVDRNMIVGYSITDVNQKIVGQFIHASMPNGKDVNGVHYDNFTKQGLRTEIQTYYENNKEETISYKVYLETNKLPTQIKVPSGKYVSGSVDLDNNGVDSRNIDLTSYLNLNLKLSVYFKDSYNLLPNAYSGQFIKLMDNITAQGDGYIDLSYSNINAGTIAQFKLARYHNINDNYLTLPGVYVFVISDTVGKNVENFEVIDFNEFVFGIKLINNAPQTDVYAYANNGEVLGDKIYSDGYVLYTNQEFVDFVIPVEDLQSYQAQLDISAIEVYRSDLKGKPWLKLIPSVSGTGFAVDISGHIQNTDRIYWLDSEGSIINQAEVDAKNRIASYLIKLDTGLTVVDNEIVDYKEYTYEISVKYVLTNSSTDYYTYRNYHESNIDGQDGVWITSSFHTSTYKVVIDRSPNDINLNALMSEQGEYFEGYQEWLANENNITFDGDVNQEIAYRSAKTVGDYYGLVNNMYYQLASSSGNLSNQAMYALTVGYESTLDISELDKIYYRKLDFSQTALMASQRMGLLPISSTYFETGEYYTFNENKTEYVSYQTNNNFDPQMTPDGKLYYRAIISIGDDPQKYESNYNNNSGQYYEIIEKDFAGNYTQYVIYFAPSSQSEIKLDDINIKVYGKVVGNEDGEGYADINLNNQDNRTFIGIAGVDSVSGLATKFSASADGLYPYYGNINIYNASREKIKTIYANSISLHASGEYDDRIDAYSYSNLGIESEIYNTIKEQGNYIIEYVNVFGQKFIATINNYTSDNHKLNTSSLEVKTDYNGTKYVTLSGLNTKLDDTYWYVTKTVITYRTNLSITYTSGIPENGKSVLTYDRDNSYVSEGDVSRDEVETDRLNLKDGIQYLFTFTDVGGNTYAVPISTSEEYYAYKIISPDNVYVKDNVTYTANQIQISYNNDFYKAEIDVYLDGNPIPETIENENDNEYYIPNSGNTYNLITLLPDSKTEPANYYGSLRKFVVKLILQNASDEHGNPIVSQTYEVYIDTRATDFTIENTHKDNKISNINSVLKNGEDGQYSDYNIYDLADRSFYNELITETVNISWTRLSNNYFTYNYELFEFINKDEYVELLKGSNENSYTIAPKENTTGKYVLKITINSKDGGWIATRVYGIYMSTTITGLYEVKDDSGELYDYSSITNWIEVEESISNNETTKLAMAKALFYEEGMSDEVVKTKMLNAFSSFGHSTAIPMYISNTQLTLHSNKDNDVHSRSYTSVTSGYTKITFYRIYRSNYQTFAVIMEVYPTLQNQNILSTLSFITAESGEHDWNLLASGTSATIHDNEAEFYKLTFSSYNKNTNANPLEKHNKIIIDIYYNNVFAKRIKGDNSKPITTIEFKNSGSYRLEIMDEAGNVQHFASASSYLNYFTLIVMKDMLYTINGEAPIQYAYYSGQVVLQINRYNDATGKNNYDINTIVLKATLNSNSYTGYEHPAESTTYIFKEYGTYLINISAKLLTGEPVSAQLVFTIINPNEARIALDFTSIYGYNIISVFNVTKTTEKDVTDKFMELLQDKSNTEINLYNKLITYERIVDVFGSSTQGKMKFRVLYEVENDDLLPSRRAEFVFTLNNETATLNSSIEAGGKTTKPVTIKFNAANIYDQIGDCYVVINGEKVLKIDENSKNDITEIKVEEVGKYYIQLMGDSGNVAYSFNFTIKEPLNTVAIILIVVVSAIAIALIGTFIWLRTRMKVR